MKQVEIVTSKVEMLLVDLPEDAKNVRIETNQSVIPYGKSIHFEVSPTKESYGLENTEWQDLPEGNWQHLGKATELTEEDWKGIVDVMKTKNLYINYNRSIENPEVYCYKHAKESGLSLLKANGVVLDIPKKPHWITKINSAEDRDLSQKQMEDYFDAESKVWRNCHVFIKQK